MHSPVAELMRTFSMTVPLFPSITTGPDGTSELPDPEGLGVGFCVPVPVGVGVGEAPVSLGAGFFVALGELLVAGSVVARGVGAVLDCEACGVGVLGVGVGVFGVGVGDVVGVAVAPLFATVKCPRRLEVLPFDHFSFTRMV